MRTPTHINSLQLIATCVSTNIWQWNKYMEGTTRANGKIILRHIKTHLPELDSDLMFKFYNPYITSCRKKKGLFVYVHSGIEYFFTYQ